MKKYAMMFNSKFFSIFNNRLQQYFNNHKKINQKNSLHNKIKSISMRVVFLKKFAHNKKILSKMTEIYIKLHVN